MASPLGWFRRNQKGMLVVFGALLMAVFGLGSVLNSWVQPGNGSSRLEETVVKYNGGDFTRIEFDNARYAQAQAIRFVEELRAATIKQVGEQSYRQRAPMLNRIDTSGTPQQIDREIMRRKMLLGKAKELGMLVGDDAVIDYLRAIGDENLTESQMQQFAFDVFQNRPDFIQIRELLKEELAIQQMFNVISSGIPRSPNITEAWEDFQKLNLRRAATLVDFPVADYLSKVSGEPPLSGMRAIFNEGQYEYPDLSGEKPGFKSRRKIRAALFTARFDDFLTTAEASVKPEEIDALYKEYVEIKHPVVMDIVPVEEPDAGTTTDEDAPPAFNLDGDDPPADDSDAENATSDENEAGTTDEEEGEEKDGDGLPESGPSPGSANLNAARQEDKKEGNQEKEEKKEDTTQEEKSADPQPTEEKQDSKQDSKQDTEDEDTEDEDTELQAEDAATTKTGEMADTVPTPDAPPQEPDSLIGDIQRSTERRVKPLDEELANLLRRELARIPAANAMTTAVREVNSVIADYGSDYNAYEQTKDAPRADREPEPEMIDIKALAAKYKLHSDVTELVDLEQLRELPLGKTEVTIERIFYGQRMQDKAPLSDYLFGNYHNLTTWQPETIAEFRSDNQHIAFITEKADPVVRTFDEARDDVVEYWRRQQAVELATQDANKLAASVNGSDSSLIELEPGKAKAVNEFTWNTQGQLYPELEGGIQTAEAFMSTAFGLKVDECGAVTDATRDNVYAIQVTAADNRTEEELREAFFMEINANQGISAGLNRLYTNDTQSFFESWFSDLDKELDIKWLAH